MATAAKRIGPAEGTTAEDAEQRNDAVAEAGLWHGAGRALRRLFAGRQRLNHAGLPRSSYCYLGDNRALALTRRGDMIYLDTRDLGLTPHIALHGIWETEVEAALARLVKPRQHVVEVGANMGYHTLAMARAIGPGGNLHAFEANPQVLPLLLSTLAVNGLSGMVTVHPHAALDQAGEVEFAADPQHIGSGHRALPGGAANYSNRFNVTAVTLDGALLDRLGRIDLLRMDAEGSEPQVLRGAEQLIHNSPGLCIVTEWSPAMMAVRTDLNALVAWLKSLGFRFWHIGAGGRLHSVPAGQLTTLAHCDLVMSRTLPEWPGAMPLSCPAKQRHADAAATKTGRDHHAHAVCRHAGGAAHPRAALPGPNPRLVTVHR
jgi:FkbM family methyltransferase